MAVFKVHTYLKRLVLQETSSQKYHKSKLSSIKPKYNSLFLEHDDTLNFIRKRIFGTFKTLHCIRYPALPLVHKGGGAVPWNPLRKPLSHRNFSIISTPYIH